MANDNPGLQTWLWQWRERLDVIAHGSRGGRIGQLLNDINFATGYIGGPMGSQIRELRIELSDAKSGGNWGDELAACFTLMAHADLQWCDLLESLDRPAAISDTPALALHMLLHVTREGKSVNHDRLFWETKLSSFDINLSNRVIDYVNLDAALSERWRNIVSNFI